MRILLLKLVDTHSIWNGLDKATSWTSRDNVEWFKPEFEAMRFKDGLELLNKLRCELLLSQIIWRFNNHRDEAIIRELTMLTLFLGLSAHLWE